MGIHVVPLQGPAYFCTLLQDWRTIPRTAGGITAPQVPSGPLLVCVDNIELALQQIPGIAIPIYSWVNWRAGKEMLVEKLPMEGFELVQSSRLRPL